MATTNITEGNTYTFKNLYSGKMLNLYAGITTNGTNVCQYTADGSDEQKWTFRSDNKLYTYGSTTKCLDRYNSSKALQHNNADIWTNTDDNNQKVAISVSGSYVKIKLAVTNLYLTAYYGTANGGNGDNNIAPGASGNVFWASSTDSNVKDQGQQLWMATLVESGSSGGVDYTINGVGLPLAEWPVGSYWTDDGTPNGNSLEYNGKECAGFARYVYARIWGYDTYGTKFGTDKNDNRTIMGNASDFSGINIGARINCDRTDGGGNHSMVILDKTSSGITVYEANHAAKENYCIIGVRTITYSDFKGEYTNIKYTSYTP